MHARSALAAVSVSNFGPLSVVVDTSPRQLHRLQLSHFQVFLSCTLTQTSRHTIRTATYTQTQPFRRLANTDLHTTTSVPAALSHVSARQYFSRAASSRGHLQRLTAGRHLLYLRMLLLAKQTSDVLLTIRRPASSSFTCRKSRQLSSH